MNTISYQNISNTDRAARIVAGFALIGFVFIQTGPIGLTALLPLIAIYPILTAFLGWDPVVSRFKGEHENKVRLNTTITRHA